MVYRTWAMVRSDPTAARRVSFTAFTASAWRCWGVAGLSASSMPAANGGTGAAAEQPPESR